MRRTTMYLAAFTLAAGLGFLPDPAVAQEEAMATADGLPEGWMMRFDRASAGSDMVDFQVMEPGWHVTTGRAGAAIFWRPGTTADGSYTAHATFHLFSPASHAEAFGLFVGGADLDGADQRYLYFLTRQTGEYLIKRRAGGETVNVVGWTAHEAVRVAPAGEEGPTEYNLAVRVGEEQVEFLVEGAVVHTLPRSEVDTDGIAGLRINHMLNLHVEDFPVE